MISIPDKCSNCGELYTITETELPGMPFGCQSCGWWGTTPDKIDNPPRDDEEDYRVGQVPKRRTD